jgi:enterochelin esterase-like enzyme
MTRYPHIGLSDPEYEHDNLRFMTLRSPALNARGDVTIYIPPGCEDETNLAAIILLHGVYGSHWDWAYKGGAHRVAQRLIESNVIRPVALVMPSDGLWGDGSGYLPHAHADYERWIVEDVRGSVTETLPCIGDDSRWFISGLSMGGYGALRLGAKYPQNFRGVSGHSSITHFSQMPKFVDDPLESYGHQDPDNVEAAHWLIQHKDSLPPLRFDCGTDDILIEENRALHQRLESEGAPHHYQEFDGGHTWEYWNEHLEDTLRFFDSVD